MKKYLLRMTCLFALTTLTTGSYVQAQSVFSPNVNSVRSNYQTRRAASADADQQRGFFTVTCGIEYSAAAIANKMIEMGGIIRSLMGNQVLVDLPMSKLDAVAAIEGVLLIDIPSNGNKKTDTARKASKVDEAHQGKADGLQSLPQAYTGKGVIIGLIDHGYDFTHPMFKDKDGNLRIKGVYIPGDENDSHKKKGESLENIDIVDDKGVATKLTLTGSFFTNPDVILDTTVVKDPSGSHGTHCAAIAAGSIMDYTGTFKAKGESNGKLGGMAPEAELMLASHVFEQDEKDYPWLKNYTSAFYDMESMYALKHFAQKAGKPLIISWSENTHDGFHDGTSTTARYIANYCKEGNPMALCSSNEGDEKNQYISRKISKGKSLNVLPRQNSESSVGYFLIKTDKEIKVDFAIVDANNQIVKCFNLPLTSKGTQEYQKHFKAGRVKNKNTGEWDYYGLQGVSYYDDMCKDFAEKGYLYSGMVDLEITPGAGLDKNNQSFNYVLIRFLGENAIWDYDLDFDLITQKQKCFPMLIISSPEEDVELQGWGDYTGMLADTMENPNKFENGTDSHSMGDWCTSGEAVVIGAYATDNRGVTQDEKTGIISLEPQDIQKIGQYAYFSSYGTDFSDEHRSYPDVSAPGYTLYAAVNSFKPEQVYTETAYTGQFKGQDKPRSYPYGVMSGTSMSTPAAAGVIALWIQAAQDKGKKLTNKDIKDIIKHSSYNDEFTKATPERFGAGKIDAYKGLLYVLGLETSIAELPTKHISAKLNGRTLIIDGNLDVKVTVYNLSGQKVLDTNAVGGMVQLPQLAAGVYAVKIGDQGSTLIRL